MSGRINLKIYLVLPVILLGVCRVQAVEYEVVILGTLGGDRSYAYAINDSGQVVGESSTSDSQFRAFLWDKDNGMRNLGVLEIPGNPGQPYYSCATGINNSGQVVGYSGYYDGPERAFLWENGQVCDLGSLGGTNSHATGINNQGQMVGFSTNSNGDRRAFLWHNGIMQDIGTLEGRATYAYGINDNGQVIGKSYTLNGYNAFIWDNGVMTNLGTIDHYGSVAKGINNSGQITGSITPEESYIRQEAVLWDNNTITTLGYLDANDPRSYSHAINENGQLVGYSLLRIGPSNPGHACLWENCKIVDLDIFFPENIYATYAYGINNSGQIVGYVEIVGGNEYRAFLMTPIPEPATRLVPGEYPTIQAAIDACVDGDVVVVAPGIYTGDGNRDIDFKGKVITVRSQNGPENCIIDCNGTQTEPHRGFYFHNYEDANSVLDGFTISGSKNSAILCSYDSSPTITNCTITGNSSEREGGGIICRLHSSPTITNCIISGNKSKGSGGGVCCTDGSNPTISNCSIIGNSSEGSGGGVCCMYHSSPTIINCTITGNSSESNGGGGVSCMQYSSPTVEGCTFSANSARRLGGGMCNSSSSSPTVTNCILWADAPSEIYGGTPTITYSDVQGGYSGIGNINADPCFVQPLPSGPIYYWKFDEGGGTTAYDSAGTNNGTVYGASWTTGRIDGALSFDGVNDYVRVPNNQGRQITTNQITLSAWIKLGADVGNTQKGIICEQVQIDWDNYILWGLEIFGDGYGGSGGNQLVFLDSDGRTAYHTCMSPTDLNSNQWYHVAVTDNAGTIRIYLDGEPDWSCDKGYGIPSNVTAPIIIGATPATLQTMYHFFNGTIDDVHIHDRALSDEEIRRLYQNGLPDFGVGDYHLRPDSPCINAGDLNFIAEPNETDIDGESRVMLGRVDIGADEWPGPRMIYVDSDANSANNGSSWTNAYKYLQDGLADAKSSPKPVEIRVARGIYKPDQGAGITPGVRTATFQLINGVTVKGGYAGFGEPNPDARDITYYETILSGDLNGDDRPNFINNSENSYHVVTGSGTDATAMLDGFIITAGNASGTYPDPEAFGGGIYNYSGHPTITNCTLIRNSASLGGGLCNDLISNPTLIRCIFIENRAAVDDGGGIHNRYSSGPELSNCMFVRNRAVDSGGAISRGLCKVTNCTFAYNYAGEGGGIYIWSLEHRINNCIFWGNMDNGGKDESAQIHYEKQKPVINYSCVQGWTGMYGGVSNIGSDPCLAPDDYHLLPDSPCINAGNPNFIAEPNETDIDGELRVMLGRVDMGADEFNPFEVDFVVINKRRIGRTVFEYECKASLHNISHFDVKNIQLEIIKTPENMRVIDPNVTFGNIEVRAGESATSIDTCTFEVNRAKAIEPAEIIWWSRCDLAATGQTMQHSGSSSVILEQITATGDLTGEGEVDFEDLAKLAGQWLRVGPPGGVPEDITEDGIVNLADFAELAGKWRGGE